jgi:hypothetical protein
MENGAGSVGVVIVGVVVVGVVVPDPPPHPAIRQTSIGIKATQKSVFIITSKPSSPHHFLWFNGFWFCLCFQ